jgi:hypothetical protein
MCKERRFYLAISLVLVSVELFALEAGLENDLGYLEPDNTGNWQFISSKMKIP